MNSYLLSLCFEASLNASKSILAVYNSSFTVTLKSDDSPLTQADQQSHEEIVKVLKDTAYPILSEEGQLMPFDKRKNWETFWMIDPLDGTKEFIKRNGEFTVNIALIHQGQPIMGVVYVPVKDILYFGEFEFGSFKIKDFSKQAHLPFESLKKGAIQLPIKIARNYTIVASRSHLSEETKAFIQQKQKEKGLTEIITVGSSLKLCMVAEGLADDYPRFGPTMEWDTAAGQAIVESMGGKVIDWKTQKIMKYNKENLLNNWFLVTA